MGRFADAVAAARAAGREARAAQEARVGRDAVYNPPTHRWVTRRIHRWLDREDTR